MRNHPRTVKRRIVSVMVVCGVSPLILLFFSSSSDGHRAYPLSTWLGLRSDHLLQAAVYPLILTMVLFAGPMVMMMMECSASETEEEPQAFQILALRNYIVAPFAEEFTFRACMLPVLWPHCQLLGSVIVCPFFFGVAHIHHVIERLSNNNGSPVVHICLESLFQFCYTSVFGAYSCYLFLRTGHLIGPVVCHMFCNFMGFPDFAGIMQFSIWKAATLACVFVVGLVAFAFLLQPVTDPLLFGNTVYTDVS
ncbi:CAAX prenyl protease 2-like isoform X2 [Corticium candelabrum]|uniref:CAAX prenyl protease 2-like isoform X2 n=1 Tax=Corticium candelabrum TaxID=121492 RepID=UPI002E266652|nr:CAAX prenyl protease 2-like isoform X2 [Corticium candelabrum]